MGLDNNVLDMEECCGKVRGRRLVFHPYLFLKSWDIMPFNTRPSWESHSSSLDNTFPSMHVQGTDDLHINA